MGISYIFHKAPQGDYLLLIVEMIYQSLCWYELCHTHPVQVPSADLGDSYEYVATLSTTLGIYIYKRFSF